MTLHTPGPWTAHGTSVAKETSGHVGRSEYPIAEVWKNLPYEEGCANARLIASCPELLEALKGLLANAPAPKGIKQDYSYILYRETARKAIAKAQGGEQP